MAISKIPSAGFQDNVKFRNLIINGSMDIAQRGTSATGLGNGDNGYYTVDRWFFQETGSPTGEFTQSQSTDVPSGQGFAKSLKMDCTTAQGSLASGDGFNIQQRFEGQNLQYLKKGTANAESFTLSFWVKSSKTGTYVATFLDQDNTRQIAKSYTIDTANTWEKKTITYAGDTTGAFDNDNNGSLYLIFYLAAGTDYTSGTLSTSWEAGTNANRAVGQVNLADNTANEWYITGVQLEAGQTASEFEFLPVDVNLLRCQRYYQILAKYGDGGTTNVNFGTGVYYTVADVYGSFPTIVKLRTKPTVDQVSGTNYYVIYRNAAGDFFDDFALGGSSNSNYIELRNSTDMSGTAGQAGFFRTSDPSAFIAFDAEL